MTDHPDQLYAVEFTEADQARLAGFSCGDEVWSKHVTEWILGSDVFDSMKRGTRVWLFETEQGNIVGFGSIGSSVWRWPPPDGTQTNILLIPMLGIDAHFQGQPADPEWRYSRQIMAHLLAEGQRIAREWPEHAGLRPQWLVLQVRADNARAIRFYERCGFELIPGVVRRNNHAVMKVWIGDISDT
jgi:ribosomal protein S18 acetylase RimI-like enzyme